MSWLARSLANSLRLDHDDQTHAVSDRSSFPSSGDPSPSTAAAAQPQRRRGIEPETIDEDEDEDEEALGRGVKEDLSELKLVLTRQLWEVASFLAPPPPPSDRDPSSPPSDREEEFEEESSVGVTDEVLAFARNIAMHPETWLDFPLDEEDDFEDFDMSDVQREHIMEIERLAPRLMALRIELCPCHMSEGYFWKVYFVLLHSRLNKQDAEALSTPQLIAARAKWMQELQSHTTSESEWFGSSASCLHDGSDFSHEDQIPISPSMAHYEDIALGTFTSEPTMFSVTSAFESVKHPIESFELRCVDKSVIEEEPVVRFEDKKFTVGTSYSVIAKNDVIATNNAQEDEEEDDWPEEDFELNEYRRNSISGENEEDISFSDLEDDDFQAPTKLTIASKEIHPSIKIDDTP